MTIVDLFCSRQTASIRTNPQIGVRETRAAIGLLAAWAGIPRCHGYARRLCENADCLCAAVSKVIGLEHGGAKRKRHRDHMSMSKENQKYCIVQSFWELIERSEAFVRQENAEKCFFFKIAALSLQP